MNDEKPSEFIEKAQELYPDMLNEEEKFFRQLELDRKSAEAAYQHLLTTMDTALAAGDYTALSALIPYIESGDGYLAFSYIGKTHRWLRILNILSLEEKYQKLLFCNGCSSAQALWEKYMLTLFAFRRLCFHMPPQSADEATAWLAANPLSHFAAYVIATEEILIPDQTLWDLVTVMRNYWTDEDILQFFALYKPPRSKFSSGGIQE